MLMLVGNKFPLDESYKFEVKKLPCGVPVDAEIYDSLVAMLDAGTAEGCSFHVNTAFRTIDEQKALFAKHMKIHMDKGLDENAAYDVVKTIIAIPGRSEHHTGLAVDILSVDHRALDDAYGETKEAKWLAENCHKFGFILRYPGDKCEITGVIYEPWHFRYVGEDAASEIMSKGICLEEYLGIL